MAIRPQVCNIRHSLLILVSLAVLLIAQPSLAGQTSLATEVVLSDDAKIYLLLQSLNEAIEKPEGIYLAPFEEWLPQASRQSQNDLIGHFDATRQNLTTRSGRRLNLDFAFDTCFVLNKEGFYASCRKG